MKHLALVIALAAFSTSAFAEGTSSQNADELRLVRSISVYIEDHVRDGCLSNPNALKVEAELILRRSEISIAEHDPPGQRYQLVIAPYGGGSKTEGGQGLGHCLVALRVELWRWARVPEGHAALVIAYRKSFLLTGYTKSRMQGELRTTVSEIISDLANEILKARGN